MLPAPDFNRRFKIGKFAPAALNQFTPTRGFPAGDCARRAANVELTRIYA